MVLICLERNLELSLPLFPMESLPTAWFYAFIVGKGNTQTSLLEIFSLLKLLLYNTKGNVRENEEKIVMKKSKEEKDQFTGWKEWKYPHLP